MNQSAKYIQERKKRKERKGGNGRSRIVSNEMYSKGGGPGTHVILKDILRTAFPLHSDSRHIDQPNINNNSTNDSEQQLSNRKFHSNKKTGE